MWFRLHRAVLAGQNVAVKPAEEGKMLPDMTDCQLIGVREDVGRNTALSQVGLQFHHGLNGRENVGKELTELFDGAAKAGGRLHSGEELFLRDSAGFKAKQQGRMVDPCLHLCGRHGAARGDSPGCDAVIRIHEDLAEVENDCLGLGHATRTKFPVDLPAPGSESVRRQTPVRCRPGGHGRCGSFSRLWPTVVWPARNWWRCLP